jgi:hypothetical protein
MSVLPRFSSAVFFTVLLFLLYLSGCASAPERKTPSSLVDVLPESQTIYARVDVESNRNLTSALFPEGQSDENMIQLAAARTDTILFSIDTTGGGSSVYSIIASGDYPRALLRSKLRKEKHWEKKVHDRRDYWYSSLLSLSIAFPERGVIMVSSQDIENMIYRYSAGERFSLPKELRYEFDISDFVLYMPKPGGDPSGSLSGTAKKYPIDMIWITMYSPLTQREGKTMYNVSIVTVLKNENDADKFEKVVKLLLVAVLKREGIGDISTVIENVDISKDGNYIRITGIPVSEEEIAGYMNKKLRSRN